MKEILGEKIPIKMWLDALDESTLRQTRNLANLPCAFHHVAIMPDAHTGYGMPIGGVLAVCNAVIPNAVGVDIGCGMVAARSSLREINTETLKKIMADARREIPVGFNHRDQALSHCMMPAQKISDSMRVTAREYESARHQLGTLGGGNHFIEIQRADDNAVWCMIHSGSRNIGKQVADHYNRLAKDVRAQYQLSIPPEYDLAYFPLDSREADAYIKEMEYCLGFARANRACMMNILQSIVTRHTGAAFEPSIDIHHNYAQQETHFCREVMVHRKGATSARAGQMGIIPGSQGAASYIVQGKGNRDSFYSCSHGAGRKMGRKQAQRELDLTHERAALDKKGILHCLRSSKDLDEAAGAYKDIEEVMAHQRDLVEIVVRLQPLAVIKG
ncbi:MAG: RtcB family protein [Endomicrobiales bacterium]|jgi:tRNA-splicing ligase RtcB